MIKQYSISIQKQIQYLFLFIFFGLYTSAIAQTIPDAPTGLTATEGINQIFLNFTAPVNNGGAAITNYEYSTDNGSSWTAVNPASTAVSILITGLTNCTAYTSKVRAVNSVGSGTASSAVSVTPRSGTAAGTNWTSYNASSDISWNGVTYGNGLYVAVANGTTTPATSRVMTSTDGISWTGRSAATSNDWQSVTFGNGLFVAVAFSGTGNRVMTSPDGITWTSRTSTQNINWQSVTYGNGTFVAVASTGATSPSPQPRVMTSTDGITWTQRGAATASAWWSVTYGNGLFVAVAYQSTGTMVMTSPNGATWTARVAASSRKWSSVSYGKGLFVAVSDEGTGNRVMTSTDGITWTARTTPADNNWNSVVYGNGLFVASAYSGTGNRIMTSPDGINWTLRNSAADNNWYTITYGNGRFVAVAASGTGNRVMTSNYDTLVPDKPLIVSITPASTSLDVAFTAPSNSGGSAISNYEYSTDGGTNWTTPSPKVTSSPLTISGLAESTAYQVQLRAVNAHGSGCASTTVNTTTTLSSCTPTTFTETITACGSYVWHGTTYTSSNNSATWTGTNAAGCDSVVTLNLTIKNATSSTLSATACDSYNWNGTAYTTSGAKVWTGTNAAGCDSVVTLNLTIKIATSSTLSATACDSYNWHGTTYTTSGAKVWTGTNATGCDSVVTLNLTIKNATSSTLSATACDSYNWHGTAYTTSGAKVWTGTNAAGCDSVVTLNLTIKNATSSTDSATACGSYLWHGTTYTSSNNTATWTGINAAGCDSVVTLKLTVNGLPSAPAGTGAFRCSSGTVSLSATPGSGETIDWYAASSGGSSLSSGSSSYNTGSITSTTTYYAETRNSLTGCLSASRTAVTATINPLPDATISASGATTFTYGNVVTLSAPTIGNALTCNGNSNYVSIPSGINSAITGNTITIEGWFNISATFNLTGLITEALGVDNNVKFGITSGVVSGAQKIYAGFTNGGSSTTVTSSADLPLNTWTHIAATYDGASLKVYVNGTLTGTVTNSSGLPSGSDAWYLGKAASGSNYFPGAMDEVRIWNIGRSQTEINNNKNTTISASSSGLVGYYKLDEASGSSAADASGNGYTGTVN